MLDRVKFFRRRQFVLGSVYLNYEGWKQYHFNDHIYLTIHPDLPITVAERQNNKAVLLGYAIDPSQPELNDEGILQRFVTGEIKLNEITEGLLRLNGRFVLIIKCSQGILIFHDPCALRQVVYCKGFDGSVWCASQDEVLAEQFGFTYDKEVLDLRNIPKYIESKEEFWHINDRTAYNEIKYLLANHYLDLNQGLVHRYWPVPNCFRSLSMDESIHLCTPILQNSIKAAVKRFDLKMGITEGSDSRRSLAASKDVSDKIVFFTHTPRKDTTDFDIPARLLPKLGIKHNILEIQSMTADFRALYEKSATWARERRGQVAYTALCNFGSDSTIFNSNLSEILRCFYWLPKAHINGMGLAIATLLNHPFAIKEFQNWINGAKTACEDSGMNILVLFDYELRSRWAAAAFYEYDIAHETFNPYNNRYLSCLELSVNERHRSGQRMGYFIKQIKYMWPEVLVEPINPESTLIGKIQSFLLNFIIHKAITPWFPLYQYLKYSKKKMIFNKMKLR